MYFSLILQNFVKHIPKLFIFILCIIVNMIDYNVATLCILNDQRTPIAGNYSSIVIQGTFKEISP